MNTVAKLKLSMLAAIAMMAVSAATVKVSYDIGRQAGVAEQVMLFMRGTL